MADKKKSGRSVTRLFGQSAVVNPQTGQPEITGAPIEVRFAYPFLHELRTKSAGGAALDKPRNDILVMVPKLGNGGDCPHYRLLSTMLAEAAHAAWGSWPTGYNPKIQDGDIPHRPKPKPGAVQLTEEQILEKNKWRRGYWIVEAAVAPNTIPRVCILQNGQFNEIPARVVDGHELYKSGDYGYISLNAWTFEMEANFGVNYGTDGVLFSRPGERIGSAGGPRSAQQMFGALAGAAAPSVPGMPQPPAAPTMAPQPQYAQPAPVAPQYAAPTYTASPAVPMAGAPGHAVGYSPVGTAPATISAPPVAPSPTTFPSSAPPMPPAAGAVGLPPIPGR